MRWETRIRVAQAAIADGQRTDPDSPARTAQQPSAKTKKPPGKSIYSLQLAATAS